MKFMLLCVYLRDISELIEPFLLEITHTHMKKDVSLNDFCLKYNFSSLSRSVYSVFRSMRVSKGYLYWLWYFSCTSVPNNFHETHNKWHHFRLLFSIHLNVIHMKRSGRLGIRRFGIRTWHIMASSHIVCMCIIFEKSKNGEGCNYL